MEPVRIVPEAGIDIPSSVRASLEEVVSDLGARIESLYASLDDSKGQWLPDIEIYHNAVRVALDQRIFREESEFEIAETLVAQGNERADQLQLGSPPWVSARGLVVRGYRSKIDGSVQPYGLVVPESFNPRSNERLRLDVWHHGRNLTGTELRFLNERQTQIGTFAPENTIVLHTFGRFSNAMKYAGEVDTFEALEHVSRCYPVDSDRISMRGFSMGGAATWHLTAHHPDRWVAATPGAGFAESAIYQNLMEKDPKPTWWEQKLWRLYDVTICAGNLRHTPTLAYSGENDPQKQAADLMSECMKEEGLDLPHIIGPETGHAYHPDAKVEIEKWLGKVVDGGREKLPHQIRFTTYSLRFNHCHWIRIDGLEQHWEQAQVDADIDGHTVSIATRNVTALTLTMLNDLCPFTLGSVPEVTVDGDRLSISEVTSDGWNIELTRNGHGWTTTPLDRTTLRKRHALQGPIDDFTFDSFVMVTPTGNPLFQGQVAEWIDDQQTDAAYQWEMFFRGRPRVKADKDVTEDDIRDHHLLLWGDPSSNCIYRRIADDLPIVWNAESITSGAATHTTDQHVPVFIYPNPLNPNRYVVVNSGFTFSAYTADSNACQTPKLPDWAVRDITATDRLPDGVVDCGFFNEQWELK